MSEKKGVSLRKSFTLSEQDLAVIKVAVEKCGFLSDSEAIRAMIKYFAENALCLKTVKSGGDLGDISAHFLRGR